MPHVLSVKTKPRYGRIVICLQSMVVVATVYDVSTAKSDRSHDRTLHIACASAFQCPTTALVSLSNIDVPGINKMVHELA